MGPNGGQSNRIITNNIEPGSNYASGSKKSKNEEG